MGRLGGALGCSPGFIPRAVAGQVLHWEEINLALAGDPRVLAGVTRNWTFVYAGNLNRSPAALNITCFTRQLNGCQVAFRGLHSSVMDPAASASVAEVLAEV